MAEIDLEAMSLDQLRDLRAQIDRAISSFTERKRRDAMAAAEEAIRQHGFSSLAEVTRTRRGSRPAARSGSKPSSGARYANPDDATQTWSGRGRRPTWVNEHLGAGRSLEDMAI